MSAPTPYRGAPPPAFSPGGDGPALPRPETRLERLVYRWSAAAVVAGALVGLGEVARTRGVGGLHEIGAAALLSLLVLGKFVVFSGLQADTPSPWTLAIMVWLIDLLFAFALASGLEGLERAPVLGRWLRRARKRAVDVLTEYPRLERMAFLGVATFVMLPIAATGAISGSFAARLLGLSRIAGVLAIALGSAAISTAFALLARFLGERGEELVRSPLLAGAALLVLVLVGRAVYLRVLGRLRTPG